MRFSRTVLPIILLCLLITGLVMHTLNNPMKERKMKELHYKGTAIAKIHSVETREKLHFYHVGNEMLVESYVVNYTFKVGEQAYSGTDIINNHKKFNKLISNLRGGGEIITLYDVGDPSRNILKR